jgi:steroid 5-alpha reductase family enzyme
MSLHHRHLRYFDKALGIVALTVIAAQTSSSLVQIVAIFAMLDVLRLSNR